VKLTHLNQYQYRATPLRRSLCSLAVLLVALTGATQVPFLQRLSLDAPVGSVPQGVRRGANGHFVLTLNALTDTSTTGLTGFVTFDRDRRILEAWSMNTPLGSANRIIDLLEQPDGQRVMLVQIDNNPAVGVVRPRYYLKKYTRDFREVWSVFLSERWFAPTDYPPVLQDAAGNFYGAIRKFFSMGGGFTHLLYKISPNGQLLWAKEVDRYPQSVLLAPQGGMLLAFSPVNPVDGGSLIWLDAEGQQQRSVRFLRVSPWDISAFPNGDLLLSGSTTDTSAEKLLIRLRPNLEVISARKFVNFSYSFERRNLYIGGNDEVYYFVNPPGTERGRVIVRLDGQAQVHKAVLIPEAQGLSIRSEAADGGGFLLPLLVAPDLNDVFLLHLDSTLQLPGCTLPEYCVQTIPFNISTAAGQVRTTNETPPVYNAPLTWTARSGAFSDYCPPFQPPTGGFTLPDSVCQGTTIRPDSIRLANIGAWRWTAAGATPDTSRAISPTFLFARPGLYQIEQQLRYRGCLTDTIRRTLRVQPAPTVVLGSDTTICQQPAHVLRPKIRDAARWRWEDGSTAPERQVTTTGIYRIEAETGNCRTADSLRVLFLATPAGFASPDSLCPGALLLLRAEPSVPGAQHRWAFEPAFAQPPEGNAPTLPGPTRPGRYRISHETTGQGCIGRAERTLLVVPRPAVTLGPDFDLCPDSSRWLRPLLSPGANAAWSDGTPGAERRIERPDTYIIYANDGFCQTADTLVVSAAQCQRAAFYAPDAFAPDSGNDNAVFNVFPGSSLGSVVLLEIYNRWGGLVFRSETGEGWSGEQQPTDLYLYRAVVAGRDNQPGVTTTGTVLLVR
jgi:hypothetical protein